MKRNLYLSIQKKEEAKQNFLKRFEHQLPEVETISVFESLHRVTAEAIYAKDSSPSYNSCAMDGIAVISSHTVTASLQNPCLLKEGVDYIEVDTGDRIELPYDAVIMAEDLIEQEQGYQIIEPTHPFKHVRAIGEDIVSQEMLIPSYHTIRAIDSSVLLSAGVLEIKVLKQPIVALIPTGDEMIDCCEPLQKDKIRETNSWMFENLVKEHQGTVLRFPIVADDPNQIEQVLLEAARKADVVIMNAGSSAGRDDYSVHAIRKLGEVFTHGVAIKPGKPVILGQILGKPVIGLPGYPVSAYLTFMEFVVPLLRQMMRQVNEKKDCIQATITKNIMSSLKYEEYVRVKLGIVHDRLIATPLERGAGASMSLVRADGFCVIPQNKEGVLAGETVTVQLVNAYEQIQKTVVVIGSHDLILDVINDQMMTQQVNGCLSSTHVGSLAGLVALKKEKLILRRRIY